MTHLLAEQAQSRAVSATATNLLVELPKTVQVSADTSLRHLEVKSCLGYCWVKQRLQIRAKSDILELAIIINFKYTPVYCGFHFNFAASFR